MEINWKKYKIKHKEIFKEEFIDFLNFFKRFLENYELKLLIKSEQTEYLLAKKNYINCFEKNNSNYPDTPITSKKDQLIRYRHQLIKLSIKAYELGDKIQEEYFTKEEKREANFSGVEKLYEKYRPLLYQAKTKEKPIKIIQAKNSSSLKNLFTKKNKDNLVGNILRLKKLYNSGSLTKAEFEKAKNKLLKSKEQTSKMKKKVIRVLATIGLIIAIFLILKGVFQIGSLFIT